VQRRRLVLEELLAASKKKLHKALLAQRADPAADASGAAADGAAGAAGGGAVAVKKEAEDDTKMDVAAPASALGDDVSRTRVGGTVEGQPPAGSKVAAAAMRARSYSHSHDDSTAPAAPAPAPGPAAVLLPLAPPHPPAPTLFYTPSGRKRPALVIDGEFVKSVLEQNKLRQTEAHLYCSLIDYNLPPKDVPKGGSAGAAAGGGAEVAGASGAVPVGPDTWTVKQMVAAAQVGQRLLTADQTRRQSPAVLAGWEGSAIFDKTKERISRQRPAVTQVIRSRKIAVRQVGVPLDFGPR